MINEAMLPFFGITDKRTIDHLVSCIEALLSNSESKSNELKREFVPYSKAPMEQKEESGNSPVPYHNDESRV